MTISEVVVKGNRSYALEIAYKVTEWSTQNRVHLNSEKCKELRISFVKDEPRFAPIVVDDNELERVSSAKLLGLTITSNLTLVQLKRSRVPRQGYFHFLHCLYTLCYYVRGTRLFLMPC